jgi:antitoxin MazE
MATLKSSLTRIGNSQGIRIPKAIVEQLGLQHGVELEVENNQLVVRPLKRVRQGWAEAAKAMHDAGEDKLLDPETPTAFDEKEWTW